MLLADSVKRHLTQKIIPSEPNLMIMSTNEIYIKCEADNLYNDESRPDEAPNFNIKLEPLDTEEPLATSTVAENIPQVYPLSRIEELIVTHQEYGNLKADIVEKPEPPEAPTQSHTIKQESLDYTIAKIKNEPVTETESLPNYEVNVEGLKEQLLKHMQHLIENDELLSRTQTGEKRFECDICQKQFTRSSNLIRHKVSHSGVKAYECDICRKRFTESGSLNTHKRIHSGEKPYECDVCNERFAHRCILSNHMYIHTGEKAYECDVCQKRFTLSGSLARHKRIHSGEKPYECDVCHKRFSQINHLPEHKRIHSGEKPYECEVCHKRFTLKGNLAKHKRNHN